MSEVVKNRIIFWTRLVSWIVVGCGAPIGVFAYKFGLFNRTTVEYDELGNVISQTNVSLNGWGIISVLLVGSFVSAIVKELADSCTGYSMLKQCYMGICKTMPLIIGFAMIYFLSGVLEQLMFCLMVLIICKLVSIPINPLPKWKFEKKGKEDYSTLAEALTGFVKKYTKRGES